MEREAAFGERSGAPRSRCARWVRQTGRNLLLAGVTLLALAAVLRALVGLLEAATLLVLALVVATLVLPRSLSRHWRRLRREVSEWLRTAARYMEAPSSTPPAETDNTAEKN